MLYHPDDAVYKNICSYAQFLDELIIVDNSENVYNKLEELQKKYNVVYKHFNDNKGIAYALNFALCYAQSQHYTWCLTMDQDSFFELSDNDFWKVKQLLQNNLEYGIISFDYNQFESQENLRDVKSWITSGNFIQMQKYQKIDGFNEELFIDFADYDLCRQFYEKGIKIGVMNYSIHHTIGNPIVKTFFGKKIILMNHSPLRYYYRYRNCYYLYKKNKKFYYRKWLYEWLVNFNKMLLFEKEKCQKIKMIKQGIKDAKKGKLGKYE